MQDNTVSQKQALRKHYAALRLSLSDTKDADARIMEIILSHPVYRDAEVLLLYAAVRGELELSPIMSAALRDGKTVAYPRCERDHVLSFCPITSKDQLVPEKYGILTPAPDRKPLCDAMLCNALCIVPALAADRRGNRLGYGGGYYDRFLQKTPVVSLCAVRSGFLTAALPTEETDVRCQYICTEEGVFVCD